MKILFWSGKLGNNGPANVTKQYLQNIGGTFVKVNSCHKYGELIEGVWKLLFCDCVVVSGVSRKGALLVGFARIFGKKSVYIMHGCASYECEINKTTCSWQGLAQEKYLLKHATLLLPVSRKYMLWVQERYPQYARKTKYLYNGIDKDLLPKDVKVPKIPNSVIAAGGNGRLKGNDIVANAVEAINGQIRLEIYGALNGTVHNSQCVRYMGRVPNDVFHQKLAQAELFVLNSIIESFSIATIEALMCGCSVLVSEVAGVTDLLALEETDIIHDPMNVEEIRGKIAYLLEHPNNERIRSKLDVEEYSYPRQVEKLEKLCEELMSVKSIDRLKN